ncbi:MAG TPA: SRPBCC domain-containing protein [bacterium]|nr:SRPBCC domain-containing protein [bacterium]
MTTQKTQPLVISRVFSIDTPQLFQAWSDPAVMEKWLFPFPAGGSVDVENTFEVGGTYHLDMHTPDGEVYTMTGEYREIIPNRKIIFTWNTTQVQETVVTVEFTPVEEGTKLSLTHDLFPDADARQQHTDGWEDCLANLEKSVVQVA